MAAIGTLPEENSSMFLIEGLLLRGHRCGRLGHTQRRGRSVSSTCFRFTYDFGSRRLVLSDPYTRTIC